MAGQDLEPSASESKRSVERAGHGSPISITSASDSGLWRFAGRRRRTVWSVGQVVGEGVAVGEVSPGLGCGQVILAGDGEVDHEGLSCRIAGDDLAQNSDIGHHITSTSAGAHHDQVASGQHHRSNVQIGPDDQSLAPAYRTG